MTTLRETETKQGYSVEIPPMLPEATRYLIEARDLLAAGHWIKNYLDDGKGNYCALGALDFVVNGRADHVITHTPSGAKAWSALTDAMGCSIPKFNNAPERTLEEMIAAFNKAIETTLS
jgi:hypothetical protein